MRRREGARCEPAIVRRVETERELALLVDAALEPIAPASSATVLQELRSELVRLAQQHAARAVHDAVLKRLSAKPSRANQQRFPR